MQTRGRGSPDVVFNVIVASNTFSVPRPAVKKHYKYNYDFFILAFYELLCIMKVYSIGIPKSETVSDQSISDKGHRTVLEKNGSITTQHISYLQIS
jgi:hypothetical protein